MEHCHSRQSAIRVRAGSFSFCILRNNCGPAYGRDIIDRPARACGFARICNFVGAFGAPLQFFSRFQLAGDAGQNFTKYLRAFRLSFRHVPEHRAEERQDVGAVRQGYVCE